MSTSIRNDLYSFLLLVVAGMLPLYIIRFSILGIPTNVFEVAVFVLAFVGICSTKIRQSWIRTIKTMPVSMKIAIGLFFLSACISTGISDEKHVSLGILKGWIIVPLLFSFFTASAVKNNPAIKSRILDSLIYSAVAVSLLGIAQIGYIGRVRSLYDVPNSLALFVVPILIIALYRGVQLKKKMYIFSALIMCIAVLATQSGGAILAIIGTIIIGWLFRVILPPIGGREGVGAGQEQFPASSPHPRLLLSKEKGVITVLFIVFITLSIFFLSGRFQYLISPLIHPGATNSATVRLQLWNIGTRLIAQHPILGIGLGQFEPAYQSELHRLLELSSRGVQATSYKLQSEFVFRDPHNWIISFWLNMGIVGLASFVYLNWLAIRASVKSKNIENKAIALALISILLFGVVDTIYWKNDLSALWWILVLLT